MEYGGGFEFTSALIVKLKNGDSFKVNFNGEKEQIDQIYKEVKKFFKIDEAPEMGLFS